MTKKDRKAIKRIVERYSAQEIIESLSVEYFERCRAVWGSDASTVTEKKEADRLKGAFCAFESMIDVVLRYD